jgi:hypothetical protein
LPQSKRVKRKWLSKHEELMSSVKQKPVAFSSKQKSEPG